MQRGSVPRGDDCPYSHEPDDHSNRFLFVSGEPVKRARLGPRVDSRLPLSPRAIQYPCSLARSILCPRKTRKYCRCSHFDLPEDAIKELFAPYGQYGQSYVCINRDLHSSTLLITTPRKQPFERPVGMEISS
jgi:hypothetical protein